MGNANLTPDYLFEVSWEVCNKIGGIHTVIATKAYQVIEKLGDKYMTIGPDVWRDSDMHPEFTEDPNMLLEWRRQAEKEGLMVRVGRWNTKGNPIAILVDFTPFFSEKDAIFSKFWELYKLDSISGQWDYIEPTLFGYATGKVIESFISFHGIRNTKVAAHFHEWMTGLGLLYLNHYQPQVGTIFTTHATVVGRSLAGNNQPLYSKLDMYDGEGKAHEFNVIAKHSEEKLAARVADVFTTVSDITAKECERFHQKPVDIVTPNGFEDSIVPEPDELSKKRKIAREKLLKVASILTGENLPEDTLMLATSGRYEFRNKGIDLLLDALGTMNKEKSCNSKAVAFILVPANQYGPRKDLAEALKDPNKKLDGDQYLTHYLHYSEYDPVMQRIKQNGINNSLDDQVKVIFVPSYLKGTDGIFDLDYYDLLVGFDLTIFPSYYEPWGYTPLESLAFGIPTITTSLAGFGVWVREQVKDPGNSVVVIHRTDSNDQEVKNSIASAITSYCLLSEDSMETTSRNAYDISKIALWENMITHYWDAYSLALERSSDIELDYFSQERVDFLPSATTILKDADPLWRRVLVQQQIPEKLKPLEEIARNLWWSWNKEAVDLFRSVDSELWEQTHENPIVLLEQIPYEVLQNLENDKSFLHTLKNVYSAYKEYMNAPKRKNEPSVSYFSMEFGLHNTLKIYSGGLGLLAGDYLKEASDYNYDMVGVGLLYRYGYFEQVITSAGTQVANDEFQDFSRLPVIPVKDKDGNWITISIALPGRSLYARVWKVQIGRIPLYLLDADIEANKPGDRHVTYKLYGGDHENRMKQELLLGIGGVRALRAIGIHTDLFHLNEGHAAFTGFERLREYIQESNMTYPEAREMIRASSLFTTHTPVPAGHDSFDENMMRAYLSHYPERLSINWNQLMNLGRENHDNIHEKFSMSIFAMNLSQEVNGVSKLHGEVSREMFAGLYKGYLPEEIHIGHVTNGVHVSTWLSDRWRGLYLSEFGDDFLERQEDRELWNRIHDVKDEDIWKIKSEERTDLMNFIRSRILRISTRFVEDPRMTREIAESLNENTLTIGFARRFATYKRAHLLFTDLNRLAEIVNNPEMPIQFVFAGKAHPNDIPGQDLIKRIVEVAKMPEFIGKIIFLENYNIQLAKHLLHGVDIWLNTPTRPLEASGTSGEKAVMNGGLHFSVLDGWWAEGYKEHAGWALPLERTFNDQGQQDELDAETVYTLLETEIAPKFYNRNKNDVPAEWIKYIKNSISQVAPEFTMNRMLRDYIDQFYSKLFEQSKKLKANDFRLTKEISLCKKKLIENWNDISVLEFNVPDPSKIDLMVGKTYEGSIVLEINGIESKNIGVEMVIIQRLDDRHHPIIIDKVDLEIEKHDNGWAKYSFQYHVKNTGQFEVGFRIFPKLEHMPHRMDLPLVKWI